MWHTGPTWFFGDNVDTDQIMPARYLSLRTAEDLGQYALSGVDPDWPARIRPGAIIVAGRNFGCGSSREHAPLGLKGLKPACVVACSFARIFYRNAINIGLPLLVLDEDIPDRTQGRTARVNVTLGQLAFEGDATPRQGIAPAPIVLDILARGGLMPYVVAGARTAIPAAKPAEQVF